MKQAKRSQKMDDASIMKRKLLRRKEFRKKLNRWSFLFFSVFAILLILFVIYIYTQE